MNKITEEKVINYYNKLTQSLGKLTTTKDSDWIDVRIIGTYGGGNIESIMLEDSCGGIYNKLVKDIIELSIKNHEDEIERYYIKHSDILKGKVYKC